jgi:pyridoxine 5'-phosphate synthase PdxJ
VAHAAMASADPMTYEFSIHVDPQRKQITASVATRMDRATTHDERYARTQRLVTARIVHAKHRVKTAAHVSIVRCASRSVGSPLG